VRELLASHPELDHSKVESLLEDLQQPLGADDLLPLYKQLRVDSTRRR
jgi:hypothetical protein